MHFHFWSCCALQVLIVYSKIYHASAVINKDIATVTTLRRYRTDFSNTPIQSVFAAPVP